MEFRHNDFWMDLILSARESAFHLEVRDAYAEPEESEPLRRFLNGEPEPVNGYDKDDWIDLVEEMIGRGATISRVRVITVPHSDYQRWLLSVAGSSVAAGEDIRYLPRHRVDPQDVPSDDWWLLDCRQVAFNLVDHDGRPAGAALSTDPKIVGHCIDVKDQLWQLATPYREYTNGSTPEDR
ncbi:hypothetical protein OG203_02065 [Nocardia sp. NBC_01499]|uniref:DUF6879 family protein n=1 Tax=Nocardia sp. NBC_01499 TaxID=2903597 RepID=UPI003867C4B6